MLIEVKNITKYYNTKKGLKVKALDHVNFQLDWYGLTFITGKSGSGKTTLMNIIGGIDSSDDGEIIIDAKSTKNFNQRDFDHYRCQSIGYVFQEYNLLDDLTIKENISIALNLQGKHCSTERINQILKQVELENIANRYPKELSMGQKQRVAIARALIKSPSIILADEPTGALDSETGKGIFELLKRISQEKLVIIISHDTESAEYYGDHIIELSDGKLIKDINKLEFKDGYAIKCKPSITYKSSLSIRKSIYFGKNNLFSSPFRLFFMTLISVTSFLIMALSFTIGSYDQNKVLLQSLYKYNDNYFTIVKTEEDRQVYFNDNELKTLQNQYDDHNLYPILIQNRSQATYNNPYWNGSGVIPVFTGSMEINQNTLDHLNFTLLSGKLPKLVPEDNEIAISKFTFEQLKNNGYINTNIENISGVSITVDNKQYIISGIIDTKFNEERYMKLTQGTDFYYEDGILINELNTILSNGLHNITFVREGYYDAHFKKQEGIFLFDPNASLTLDVSPIGPTSMNVDAFAMYPFESSDSIYWVDGINRSLLCDNEIILSLNDIPPYILNNIPNYLNLKSEALNDLVEEYALSHFFEVEEQFKTDYGNESTAYDYFEYILNHTSNQYSPANDRNDFMMIANNKVFSDYYLERRNTFILSYIRNQKPIIKEVRIVGFSDKMYGSNELIQFFNHEDEGDYLSIVSILNHSNSDLNLVRLTNSPSDTNQYFIANEIAATINYLNSIFDNLSSMFNTIGFILLIFASFLLANLMSKSINDHKKEIGILRALGASRLDVIKIFLSENVIISIIIYFFTLVGVNGIVYWINKMLFDNHIILVSLLRFTFVDGVLLFIPILLIAMLASFIPVYKFSKKKPIDLIKYFAGGSHD